MPNFCRVTVRPGIQGEAYCYWNIWYEEGEHWNMVKAVLHDGTWKPAEFKRKSSQSGGICFSAKIFHCEVELINAKTPMEVWPDVSGLFIRLNEPNRWYCFLELDINKRSQQMALIWDGFCWLHRKDVKVVKRARSSWGWIEMKQDRVVEFIEQKGQTLKTQALRHQGQQLELHPELLPEIEYLQPSE